MTIKTYGLLSYTNHCNLLRFVAVVRSQWSKIHQLGLMQYDMSNTYSELIDVTKDRTDLLCRFDRLEEQLRGGKAALGSIREGRSRDYQKAADYWQIIVLVCSSKHKLEAEAK
jgi:hypothetical protein